MLVIYCQTSWVGVFHLGAANIKHYLKYYMIVMQFFDWITMKFYSPHDSTAVVAWTKFHSALIPLILQNKVNYFWWNTPPSVPWWSITPIRLPKKINWCLKTHFSVLFNDVNLSAQVINIVRIVFCVDHVAHVNMIPETQRSTEQSVYPNTIFVN